MSGRERMFTDILEDPNCQSVIDDDVDFIGAKKNLLDTFNKNDLIHLAEHMKVYLRIRPFFQADFDRKENQNCFRIENEHTLITSAPKDSHTYRNFSHGLGKTIHRFTFSKIFPEETTQKEFFDSSMLDLVQNFIEGQNCLVFTYGITSSGKTYTIQGKPRDAGILPRTLDVLFNSIDSKQCSAVNHKPMMFMDVCKLTPNQIQTENKIKEQVMKMCSEDDQDVMTLLGENASDQSVINSMVSSDSSNVSSALDKQHKESTDNTSDLFADFENRIREETAVSVADQGQIRFSVWVSFAEIYNEQIFDLLDPIPKKKNSRRPILGLRDDKNGSPYIKGLKEICVTNADEAYKLLTVGQKNLRMACTKLNHNSSRSHCIFNIKIIRVSDCQNPHFARVSMLSLCDLAGSERSSKTHATGDRLKEAGNINTSLMTLGRCIDLLRYNQLHKEHPKIVPFRESKLTRLFQNFFCGRGKAAMIVNVNQCGSMFDETLNVLKFSAIAKQVVVVQKQDPKPKMSQKTSIKEYPAIRPSIPWEAPPTPRTLRKIDNDLQMVQNVRLPEDDDSDLEETDQEIDDLLATIKALENKLNEERRSKIRLEAQIRQEVCEEMMRQIIEIEDECSERIREKEIEKEEMRVKLFMSTVNKNKRRRKDEDDDDDDEFVSSMLLHAEKVKVEELNKKLEEMQSQISRLNKDVETLTQEKTSLQFQLAEEKRISQKNIDSQSFSEKSLMKELKEQMNQVLGENLRFRETIREQETKITDLTEMLHEAAETFQEKEEEIEKLKTACQEDEEKLKQQAETLCDLRTTLAKSSEALEESKTRLGNKNEKLASLESQILLREDQIEELKKHLEQLEKSKPSRKSLELDCLIKEKEERIKRLDQIIASKDLELEQVKQKLKKEEEESAKRDQALIHGYTAEINSHKSQLLALKTKVVGLENRLQKEESVREDLNKQIKMLKSDLDKSGQTPTVHEHSSEISKSTLEDMNKHLEAECCSHSETKSKMMEMTNIDTEKEKEMKELSQKVKDLQEQLRDLAGMLLCKEEKLKDAEFSMEEFKSKVEHFKEENKILKSELENLMQQVVNKQNELDSAKENFEKTLSKLMSDIREKDEQREQLEKRVEELEVVNTELRDMISQTTNDLSKKEEHMKCLVAGKEIELKTQIQTLDQDNKKLSSENQILLSHLKEKKAKLEETEQKVVKLNSQVTEQQMQCESLSMNLLVLKEKLSTEENNLHSRFTQQLKDMDDKFKITVKDLQDKLISKEEEFNRHMALKHKELKDAESKLVQREEELHNAFNKQQNELGNILVQKEKEFDDKLKDYDRIVKSLELMKQEMADIEKKWQVASQEVEQLQESLEEEKFQHVAIKCELELKVQEFEELNVEASELRKIVEEMKIKENSINNELNKLKSELDEKTAESCELEGKCCEMKIELQELRANLDKKEELSQKSPASNTENKVMALEQCKKLLEKQLTGKEVTIEKIKKEKEKYVDMLKENENVLLALKEKVESVKDALLKSKKDSELTIQGLQNELSSKERDLERVQHTLSEVKSQLGEGENNVKQLNTAILELAELKSALHMEKTLHNKYKQEKTELSCRLEEEMKANETNKKENEILLNEKNKLITEMTILKEQMMKNEEERLNEEKGTEQRIREECQQTLNDERQTLEQLRCELSESNDKFNVLKEDKIKTVSSLEEQLEMLNNDLTSAREMIESYKSELEKLKKTQTVDSSSSELHSQELSRLHSEMEIHKKRNQELEVILLSMKNEEMESMPGCSRRLRKEKIGLELKLINTKHELELLKKKLEDGNNSGPNVSDVQLDNKLTELKKQLEVKEEELKRKCEELELSQRQIVSLQQQLQNVESSLKDTPTAPVPNYLSSSESLVSKELQKSQDRESKLRQQLKQASCTLKENMEKISELEESLSKKEMRILTLNDTLRALQAEKESGSQSKEEELRELKLDVKRKTEKLDEKSSKVKELKQKLELERERFEIALKDAKANENLLETLKKVIQEQEETMETQDAVLNSRDEEIQSLQDELRQLQTQLDTERHQLKLVREKQSEKENQLSKLEEKFSVEQDLLEDTIKKHMSEQQRQEKLQDADNKHLQSQLESQTQEVDRLKKQIEMLLSEKGEIERQGKTQREELEKMKKKEELIKEECADLKRQVDKHLIQLEQSKRREEMLTEERNALQRKTEKQLEEMQTLEEKGVSDQNQLKCQLLEENKALQRREESLNTECSRLKHVVDSLTKDKDRLNTVLHENNVNIASLEKLLTEKNNEVKEHSSSDEQLKTEYNSLKEQLKSKSFEILKLEKEKKHLEKELTKVNEQLSENSEKMQIWRQNRDELVSKLETLLKDQAAEIKELKKKLHDVREEKAVLQSHTEVSMKANEAIISDLKMSNSQLQQQVAKLQGISTPPAPVFVNDDVDTRGHLTIDATPPSAVKGLKKSLRKRCHQTEIQTEQQEESSERRPKRKAASIAKGKILNIVSGNSPLVKAAAKSNGTPESSKKGSRKRQLYKETISAPFDCAPFMPSVMETPETVDVHEVVTRQLRDRRKTKAQNTVV